MTDMPDKPEHAEPECSSEAEVEAAAIRSLAHDINMHLRAGHRQYLLRGAQMDWVSAALEAAAKVREER